MKYVTGKDSKVGHSTGTHYDEDKKKKKNTYKPVKHSTSAKTSIKHTTGIEFEKRAVEDQEEEE